MIKSEEKVSQIDFVEVKLFDNAVKIKLRNNRFIIYEHENYRIIRGAYWLDTGEQLSPAQLERFATECRRWTLQLKYNKGEQDNA